ncbi:MAG: methyltransferase domain-containing protein [Ideonella sp.]|nr:methyltransferase domain-containing protein [Ideonella sp.]
MTQGGAIIGLADWLETPAGRYLLDWERRQIEAAVVDIFGFHALQLGLPQLDALAANRMPHRWVAVDRHDAVGRPAAGEPASPSVDGPGTAPPATPVSLHCDFDALPFDSQSLDLVVLPHALELARDPHLALAEVERVLMPEGKVVIVGFNPASLWGLRQHGGRLVERLGGRSRDGLFLPTAGEFIGYRRLRDWLRLLSFEVEAGHFGCYRPALRSQQWLARWGWMEALGDRWWPVFGAVYMLVAVKRVRGMRLVGLARAQHQQTKAAPAVAVQQRQDPVTHRALADGHSTQGVTR